MSINQNPERALLAAEKVNRAYGTPITANEVQDLGTGKVLQELCLFGRIGAQEVLDAAGKDSGMIEVVDDTNPDLDLEAFDPNQDDLRVDDSDDDQPQTRKNLRTYRRHTSKAKKSKTSIARECMGRGRHNQKPRKEREMQRRLKQSPALRKAA